MIKLYNNCFIGTEFHKESNFTLDGSDSRANFLINLKTQPNNWIYRHKEITYIRNQYGHRSKEIEDLEENFILFLGCSITFGSGLSLETTYPYLVSKFLNIDYYNLSVEASGADTIAFNFFQWQEQIKKDPKYIVIQWPEPYRFFQTLETPNALLGPWVSYIKDLYKKELIDDYNKIVQTEILQHYYKIIQMCIRSFIKMKNIRMFEFETKDITPLDYARDLKHPGIETNKKISEQVISFLTS